MIGSTQVNIPSIGNEKVPYYDYILENVQGEKLIKKSFDQYTMGTLIDVKDPGKKDQVIGVVGMGQLGSGIAEHVLRNGYGTIIKTRSADTIGRVRSGIGKRLLKDNTGEQAKEILENLSATTDYSGLASCDIVIEAAVEDLDVKKEVFGRLSEACRKDAILASNTSSLSIDQIASATDRPDKVIGMHFFNPVSKMGLVEVVRGARTSDETVNAVLSFCLGLQKKPIIVKNSPGFIVNRLLLPMINDATRLLEDGVASKDNIDAAMVLGLNHPMGPFKLADLIGIDVCVSILNTLHTELKEERYRPARTLCEMSAAGRYGRKTGSGFYDYQ